MADVPNMLRKSWWDRLELSFVQNILTEWAMQIDFLAADGPVVTQVPLPPEVAQRKRDMNPMYGGQNGNTATNI